MNLAMLRTVLALGVAFSALAVAEESAFAPLVGKEWYGLYLQGKKAGYAFEEVAAPLVAVWISRAALSSTPRLPATRFWGVMQ